jgi:hypothetical protein
MIPFNLETYKEHKTCKTMLTQYNNGKVVPYIRAYSRSRNIGPYILTAAQDSGEGSIPCHDCGKEHWSALSKRQ